MAAHVFSQRGVEALSPAVLEELNPASNHVTELVMDRFIALLVTSLQPCQRLPGQDSAKLHLDSWPTASMR